MRNIFRVLLFLTVSSIYAQTSDPVWIMFENAKKEYYNSNLGESFNIFRKCLDKKAVFPEAEMWIGYIYEKEGEYTLALKQFEKVIEQEKYLFTKDDKISMLYHIASIYELRHQYKQFEDTLLEIANQNPVFSSNEELEYRESILNTMEKNGFTNALELYRFEIKNAFDAHRQLGIFYYLTGRYQSALLHLTMAAVSASSTLIEYFKSIDPDYVFRDLEELFVLGERYERSSRFFEECNVYQVFYYLAASLHARGKTVYAKQIWWELIKYDEMGEWGSRSNMQYKEPFIEPLMDIKSPY